MTEQAQQIHGIFPCPVNIVKRDTNLTNKEEKEIRKIVNEGMRKNSGNSSSYNSYIFNGKLKKIKQFCEQQLKIYVEQVIVPKEELDLYITQSWLSHRVDVNEKATTDRISISFNTFVRGILGKRTNSNELILK